MLKTIKFERTFLKNMFIAIHGHVDREEHLAAASRLFGENLLEKGRLCLVAS